MTARHRAYGLIAALIAASSLILPPGRPAQALIEPYNAAYLISDDEFVDAGALSCGQIQEFLNARKGILKAYSDEGKTAAQIICEQSAAFTVNPKLLLTLLQKEMRLLSDPEPDDKQLAWAMGCGPGWDSTRGLANQAECAARTLRKRFDTVPLGAVVDGVTPINRGTLALYRYTEHVAGNSDFWKIWTQYWSSEANGANGVGGPANVSPPAELPKVEVVNGVTILPVTAADFAPPAAAPAAPPAAPDSPVVVDSKAMETIPKWSSVNTCKSGWAMNPAGLGGHQLLTPNAATAVESTNAAVWRPNLAVAGKYRVLAYVPNHGKIPWPCGGMVAAAPDTSRATYQITSRAGVKTVVADQAPVNDDWLDLGVYTFDAGAAGSVRLSDLTGEPSNTRWVAMDEMKWVYQGP